MKSRFAPSPTGFLHLGNARTALFSALLAIGKSGHFLLRIEDTDQERSSGHFTEQLVEDLQWLGLNWDEGAIIGGDAGPYWQSQRQAIYDEYYHQLEQKRLVYPCFCTQEQLELSRKIQRSQGKPPRYAGTCKNLTAEQIQEKLSSGIKPSLRFQVESKQTVQFHDLVKGRQRYNTDDIGDFIIRRADGTAAFFFCNAIDDALMGVTHVLRGEDHLTNTPRQLLLLKALDLPEPDYGHITLIVGSDGSPLSKRHGSKSVKELRELGFFSAALVNYLARLGHYYADNSFLSLKELGEKFSFEHLGNSPAKYDPKQLEHWQKEAVMQASDESIWAWLPTEVKTMIPETSRQQFIALVRANVIYPADAEKLAKILFAEQLTLLEPELSTLKEAGNNFFAEAAKLMLQHEPFEFKSYCQQLGEQLKVKGKALFMPLRIALTGQLHGPELGEIIHLMGLTKAHQRLLYAANL